MKKFKKDLETIDFNIQYANKIDDITKWIVKELMKDDNNGLKYIELKKKIESLNQDDLIVINDIVLTAKLKLTTLIAPKIYNMAPKHIQFVYNNR